MREGKMMFVYNVITGSNYYWQPSVSRNNKRKVNKTLHINGNDRKEV